MHRKPLPPGAVLDASISLPQSSKCVQTVTVQDLWDLPPPYEHLNGPATGQVDGQSGQHYHDISEANLVGSSAPHHSFYPVYDSPQISKHLDLQPLTRRTNVKVIESISQEPESVLTAANLVSGDTETTALPKQTSLPPQGQKCEASLAKSSGIARALEETSHFLGGLLTRPVEYTKYYSILRHSHGLVCYKGPSTRVAITVFSDRPLPTDRKYWLQLKGWTGNTGMKLKALVNANSNWINVTPVNQAQPADLSSSDERAWQRDIKKELSKETEANQYHAVRETAVLRIPCDVLDGYFRVVLTKGDSKSILCPSPVFRVASASMSAGSIKGASLTTLPLELGINIMQSAANQALSRVATPYTIAVKQGIKRIIPEQVNRYASSACSPLSTHGLVDSLRQPHTTSHLGSADHGEIGIPQYLSLDRPDFVGSEDGPMNPFPVRMSSRIVRGSGIGLLHTGIPTANLGPVPADKLTTPRGVYCGWARIVTGDKEQDDAHSVWRHAIISIVHDPTQRGVIAIQKEAKAYLLHNFGTQDFLGCRIDLVIMGYLRPIICPEQRQAYSKETLRDIEITRTSLDRERWTSEYIQRQQDKIRDERSLMERGIALKTAAQRNIEKVSVHRIGVRTVAASMSDRNMYGNGGIYIVRDKTAVSGP